MEYVKLKSKIAEKYITIIWTVSTVCNYKCSYCIDHLHKGKSFPNYQKFVDFLHLLQTKYPDKIIRLILMGGEVTLWKNLIPFTKEVKSKFNIIIFLVSNGSQSLQWWKDNSKYFDYIMLSYHIEKSSVEHFINVSKIIRHKGHILLMLHFEMVDKIMIIGREISEKGKIYVSPKLLRLDPTLELYSYTKKQIEESRYINFCYFPKQFNELISAPMEVQFDNNKIESFLFKEYETSNKYNRLKGWYCYGGIENFYVDEDGEIFGGYCKQGTIGNIYNDKIELPDEPFLCGKDVCIYSTDLDSATKIRNA